jgi:hypothetical protein
MKADDILKKHEDANEMHFHEVDRKFIIEAMEEYAALLQPPVSRSFAFGECANVLQIVEGGEIEALNLI